MMPAHKPAFAPLLYGAPLQGFTDHRFRNAFHRHFGGIDHFMAPYIRLDGKGGIKAAVERDLLPANNMAPGLIPQVMTRDAEAFLSVVNFVEKMGYKALNWNLGCPYPMVAKRGMGAGLLKDPDHIGRVLQAVMAESSIRISVKMRLGYEHAEEILGVLPILDQYPLEYIIIHPRIGTQLYKGDADPEAFDHSSRLSRHRIIYNGDIGSVRDFHQLQNRFPHIDGWMLGRGMLADPFLPAMIKAGTENPPGEWTVTFSRFHDELLTAYTEALSGPKHVLMKMYSFWEYFIQRFPFGRKGLKGIKKARTLDAYCAQVDRIIQTGDIQRD